MKSIRLLTLYMLWLLGASVNLHAQTNPVSWKSTIKKIGANKYELHLSASVILPWHLFSQIQPADAIPMPTLIRFTKNPLISFVGKVKEIGKMEKHTDQTQGFTDHRYANSLEFVQVFTIKGTAKTNIAGSVTYQACTDEQCLPPATMNFNLKIE